MSRSTTSPLHAMPVLDVPFPRTVAAASTARPAGAVSGDAPLPEMVIASTNRTILGVAPAADDQDSRSNRPTLPDAPLSRARPGRTIVGVGPSIREPVTDDTPEIATEPIRIDATHHEAPDLAFEPSPFARDPGLGAAESIRLPRRRIEAGDWLLFALIVAIVVVALTLLF